MITTTLITSFLLITPMIDDNIKDNSIIENKKRNLEFDKVSFINESKKYFVDFENQAILYSSLFFISKK